MKTISSLIFCGFLSLTTAHAHVCQEAYQDAALRAHGLKIVDKLNIQEASDFFKGQSKSSKSAGIGMFALSLLSIYSTVKSTIDESQARRDEAYFNVMSEVLSEDPDKSDKAEKRLARIIQDKVTKDRLDDLHDKMETLKNDQEHLCPEEEQIILSQTGLASISPYKSALEFIEKVEDLAKIKEFFSNKENFTTTVAPFALDRHELKLVISDSSAVEKNRYITSKFLSELEGILSPEADFK